MDKEEQTQIQQVRTLLEALAQVVRYNGKASTAYMAVMCAVDYIEEAIEDASASNN